MGGLKSSACNRMNQREFEKWGSNTRYAEWAHMPEGGRGHRLEVEEPPLGHSPLPLHRHSAAACLPGIPPLTVWNSDKKYLIYQLFKTDQYRALYLYEKWTWKDHSPLREGAIFGQIELCKSANVGALSGLLYRVKCILCGCEREGSLLCSPQSVGSPFALEPDLPRSAYVPDKPRIFMWF